MKNVDKNYIDLRIKPVLLYNSSTWGLTKKGEDELNSFRRQQLRRLIGIKYPHIISNRNLYYRFHEVPIMFYVFRGRWRLFGHILGLPRDTPANKAM